MARYDTRYDAGHGRATQQRSYNSLCGYRPHGRQPPHRTPCQHNAPQAPADGGPQAAGRRRWRYGYDRRPVVQGRRTQTAHPRRNTAQRQLHQEAAGAFPRLRQPRQRCRNPQQLRLDEGLSFPRFHPRRGQAHHCQLYDDQGLGQETYGDGHLLHRVQLPAAAGLRLPDALSHQRLQAPDGWQRPVGQHHHRHRADTPYGRRRGVCFDLPAHHQGRRHQVWQDRGRQRVARPRKDQPLQVLPVLAQLLGCRHGALYPYLHPLVERGGRRA